MEGILELEFDQQSSFPGFSKHPSYLVSKYRFVWLATTCPENSYSESLATVWMLLSI